MFFSLLNRSGKAGPRVFFVLPRIDEINGLQVANYTQSTDLLAPSLLRNVLGTRDLSELLTNREAMSAVFKTTLDHATHPSGIKVERVEM